MKKRINKYWHIIILLVFAVLNFFSMNVLIAQNPPPHMDITQTISDHAQQQTIAFDGVAFITGDFCSCTFLPPGKVADFCGFQYLRDNDPTNLGHNTDFVTIIAYNILHLLNTNQFNQFIALSNIELPLTNLYGNNRFPLIKAFRRYYEHNMPVNAIGLNKDTILEWSAKKIYNIDGQISYQRCKVMGAVLRNMTVQQKATLDSLKNLNGIGNWPNNLSDPLQGLGLSPDISVLIMTYASEMYAWYAGNVDADVYFCPERQGTYFGSFYMKDIKAMHNPGYTISSNMTDSVGSVFLNNILFASQAAKITSLVDSQRTSLYSLVDIRDTISKRLRGFLVSDNVDSNAVISWSEQYGRLDGMISYLYATHFSAVGQSCTTQQMDSLLHLRNLDSFPCTGAYMYSAPIQTPTVINTDFFFTIGNGINESYKDESFKIFPNPANNVVSIQSYSPFENTIQIKLVNILGETVISDELISGDTTTYLNISSVPAGLYFINIYNGINSKDFKIMISK